MSNRARPKKSKRQPIQPPTRRKPAMLLVLSLLFLSPLVAAPLLFFGQGTYTVENRLGKVVVQREPGAAINISPNAVGAQVSNVRVVGFERALNDSGRGSNISGFEAWR